VTVKRVKPLEEPSVVVIGGTGFLGSTLVEKLAERGRVAMLSRQGRWRWGSRPIGVTGISCDITESQETARLYEVFRGAKVVINLAGTLWKPSIAGETYERVHVEGTRLVLDALHAAAGAQPVRLVHVSTTGVLGPTGPHPKSEADEPAPSTEYERTKLEGEKLALAARGAGVEVVVVRPGLVYGPRDMHLLPFFQAIDRGLFRPIAQGRARWQPVYVDDVIAGLIAASTAPNVDGAVLHFAGAERLTVTDFAKKIATAMGRKPHSTSIPYPAAYVAGVMLEALTAPLRGDPPLSRARVRTLTEDRLYRIAEAERRLGWKPQTALETGLEQTVGWYRGRNLLNP
jgi:nucleoside-diphosphate-sugar epimerase